MSKQTQVEPKHNAVRPTATPSPKPSTDVPVPTVDLIAQLRAASSIEDAVNILSPTTKKAMKVDTVYEVNPTCTTPLPQKRGLSVLIYATAVRLNKRFNLADLEAELPGKKALRYWVTRLIKLDRLIEVN
jgi:hypothetical protein